MPFLYNITSQSVGALNFVQLINCLKTKGRTINKYLQMQKSKTGKAPPFHFHNNIEHWHDKKIFLNNVMSGHQN